MLYADGRSPLQLTNLIDLSRPMRCPGARQTENIRNIRVGHSTQSHSHRAPNAVTNTAAYSGSSRAWGLVGAGAACGAHHDFLVRGSGFGSQRGEQDVQRGAADEVDQLAQQQSGEDILGQVTALAAVQAAYHFATLTLMHPKR